MVLDAIPFDERPNVVAVVPDAVPAVVVNEVVAEGDVDRQGHLLLWAVVADLVVLKKRVRGLVHTVSAAAFRRDGRKRIADIVMNPTMANHGVVADLDADLSSRDFGVLD